MDADALKQQINTQLIGNNIYCELVRDLITSYLHSTRGFILPPPTSVAGVVIDFHPTIHSRKDQTETMYIPSNSRRSHMDGYKCAAHPFPFEVLLFNFCCSGTISVAFCSCADLLMFRGAWEWRQHACSNYYSC